ncbi:hypothetical protein GKODMF_10845 [Candidatus Electrothrix gigas]
MSLPESLLLKKSFMKTSSIVSENQIYGIYCLTVLFTSAIFVGLHDLGWKIFIPLFFISCFWGWFHLSTENVKGVFLFERSNLKIIIPKSWSEFFIGILIVSPIFLHLFLTWNQEFPFLGDHDHHMFANMRAGAFWMNYKWSMILFFSSLILAMRFRLIHYWLPCITLFLIYLSCNDTSSDFYTRYPAVARFLSIPFVGFGFITDANHQYNFSRLINSCTFLVWIYILRPLFLHRKPNWYLIPFGAVFFFQAEVIYYFNTSYLEPLSSIFLLLSVEWIFVHKQRNSYVVACLLVGLAGMVKEQAVFVLPWVWLAGKPWTWNVRQWGRGIIVGITSITPFLIYYLVRAQKMSSARNYSPISLEQWVNPERYQALFGRLGYHLGWYGIIAIGVVSIFAIVSFFISKKYRHVILCVIGGALTQLIFFFADTHSANYLGYFRFSFISIALFSSLLLLAENIINTYKTFFYLKIFSIIIIVTAIYSLIPFFNSATTHDIERNFTEHTDSPIYLSIESLIKKAEVKKMLNKGDHIYISDTTGYNITAVSYHYKEIFKAYSIETTKLFKCSCSGEAGAILIPFIYFSGMNSGLRESPPSPPLFISPPERWAASWFAANKRKKQCYEEMKNSCNTVITEIINGELVGLLGVKI